MRDGARAKEIALGEPESREGEPVAGEYCVERRTWLCVCACMAYLIGFPR